MRPAEAASKPEILVSRLLGQGLTRREWFHVLLSACGMCLAIPSSRLGARSRPAGKSILDQFLGEILDYRIGFWLLPHCGEAKTSLFETGSSW